MEKRGLCLLLLISGGLLVCDLQPYQLVRRFQYISLSKSWSDAQTYCRGQFLDLATIQNSANNTEAQKLAGTSKFWIGLFNGSWKWSQEEKQGFLFSSWYTSWASGQPQSGDCVVISNTGSWSSQDCGNQNQFFCYNALLLLNILVEQSMTWSNAQAYCRSKYTDLSSIQNLVDNGIISLLLPFTLPGSGSTSVAWIGLHRPAWAWSDGSSASYRTWGSLQSTNRADCVTMDPSSASWFWQPCSDLYPFLCYTDIRTSAMQSVKIQLNEGSADLNDLVVQESILQQLKQKMKKGGVTEEVELRWMKRSDGNIFHKEAAPPAGCNQNMCDIIR